MTMAPGALKRPTALDIEMIVEDESDMPQSKLSKSPQAGERKNPVKFDLNVS